MQLVGLICFIEIADNRCSEFKLCCCDRASCRQHHAKPETCLIALLGKTPVYSETQRCMGFTLEQQDLGRWRSLNTLLGCVLPYGRWHREGKMTNKRWVSWAQIKHRYHFSERTLSLWGHEEKDLCSAISPTVKQLLLLQFPLTKQLLSLCTQHWFSNGDASPPDPSLSSHLSFPGTDPFLG